MLIGRSSKNSPHGRGWSAFEIPVWFRLGRLRVKLRRTGAAQHSRSTSNSGNANRLAAAVGECCKRPSARRPRKDRKQNLKQSLVAGDCDGKVCPIADLYPGSFGTQKPQFGKGGAFSVC